MDILAKDFLIVVVWCFTFSISIRTIIYDFTNNDPYRDMQGAVSFIFFIVCGVAVHLGYSSGTLLTIVAHAIIFCVVLICLAVILVGVIKIFGILRNKNEMCSV